MKKQKEAPTAPDRTRVVGAAGNQLRSAEQASAQAAAELKRMRSEGCGRGMVGPESFEKMDRLYRDLNKGKDKGRPGGANHRAGEIMG